MTAENEDLQSQLANLENIISEQGTSISQLSSSVVFFQNENSQLNSAITIALSEVMSTEAAPSAKAAESSAEVAKD